MKTLDDYMRIYHEQMNQGDIAKAYRGLMQYMMQLKTFLSKKYPDYSFSSNLYLGYMDMTFFTFTPPSLSQHKLKSAVVFLHEPFTFEAWLTAHNRKIQAEYYQLFCQNHYKSAVLHKPEKGVDAIASTTLVNSPSFSDFDLLTKTIETGMLSFNEDIISFLNALTLSN